jgi:hypothetical protein
VQSIQAAECQWHQQLAAQREVMAVRAASGVQLQGQLSLEDLIARGLLFATDCSALMLMEHASTQEVFTVRSRCVLCCACFGASAFNACDGISE